MTYIKGYKVDLDKVTEHFGTKDHDPHNTRFLAIVQIFPRTSYMYIGGGEDLKGNIDLVVVLDEADTRAELEGRPMPDFDLRGADEIMTEGVWEKF